MHIAVNTRLMMPDRLEGIGMVTHEVMRRMVTGHPGDRFDYYFDRAFDPSVIHGSNVRPHAFFPPTRLPVLIRYWLNGPVKRHVRRSGADVFFSPDGFLPEGLHIPKVAILHDVAFARYPEHLPPRIRRFYARWMPRYVQSADHIITVSEFSKKEILEVYPVSRDKVSVVYNGISAAYKPLSAEERLTARNRFAGGHPYFVFLGAIHPRKNILELIRAFEQFKAEHAGDHQLVLAGRPSWHTDEFFQMLEKSPVRPSIHLPGYVPTRDAVHLIGGAEAMIYPSIYEGFGLPLLEAMAAGVPVICSDVSSLPEVAGGAALLFSPGNPGHLADRIAQLVTSADLRGDLIQRGLARCGDFSWDEAARQTYAILEKVARRD